MDTLEWSDQYQCPFVTILDGNTADDVIEECRAVGAIFDEGDGDECFVVDIGRGVGPELYTERALRRSIKPVPRNADYMDDARERRAADDGSRDGGNPYTRDR